MNQKPLGKTNAKTRKAKKPRTYARPSWVPKGVVDEEELCPDCFKVVGSKSPRIFCAGISSFSDRERGILEA
jgi:hypothetical protein